MAQFDTQGVPLSDEVKESLFTNLQTAGVIPGSHSMEGSAEAGAPSSSLTTIKAVEKLPDGSIFAAVAINDPSSISLSHVFPTSLLIHG